MRSKKINLNLMAALNALLSARSITEAANRLALSQPAMSIALRKLRDHYQDKLVTPGRDGLILTELGRELRPLAAQVIHDLDRIITLETGFDPTLAERRFVIRAPDLIELTLIGDLVRRVSAIAPGVQIDCIPRAYGARDTNTDAMDLVIVAERFRVTDMLSERLHTETFSCMAWEGNSRVGESLTIDDFQALRHASVGSLRRVRLPNAIDDAILAAGIKRRVQVRTSMFSALPHLIIGTDLLATTYTRFARARSQDLAIRVFEPPFPIASTPFVMQWPIHRDNDPGLAWLRAELKQAAAAM